MKQFFLFCCMSLLGQFSIYGQTIPGPTDPNAFSDLSEARIKLNAEIPDLKEKINNIYIPDIDNIKSQITNLINNNDFYSREIERLKKINPNDTSINSYQYSITANMNFIVQLRRDSTKTEVLSRERDELLKQLDVKKLKLNDVESRINQLLIPKISQQNFMFWSSIAFVLLMGFLLGTFFYVVSRDTTIRQKIFGTDSGIQFITLFSIVIAIILFGLTGILEGKELSALLGSVAGYILGKVTISTTPQTITEIKTGN